MLIYFINMSVTLSVSAQVVQSAYFFPMNKALDDDNEPWNIFKI